MKELKIKLDDSAFEQFGRILEVICLASGGKITVTDKPGITTDAEEVCRAAVKKFGVRAQVLKAIEELNELSRALARWLATDFDISNKLLENVHEEMADALIMCMQLEVIFDAPSNVFGRKLERLRGMV